MRNISPSDIMDLHHLEYIVEIVRQNNISKAAEILHVSQPTLSIYLKQLEQKTGINFFIRNNNILTVTEAGKKYADTCNRIILLRNELYDELYRENQHTIHVGILSSNAAIFNHVFMKFQPEHPTVTIHPMIEKSDQLYDAVLKGILDFAYVTSYAENYQDLYTNVERVLVKDYELVIFISKSNPVFQKLKIQNGTILAESLPLLNQLTLSVSNVIPMIRARIQDELLPKLNIKPHRITSMGNLEFLTTTLYLNNQFSIMPFSYVANDDFAKIMLPGHPQIHKLLIYQKNHAFSSIDTEFMDLVQKQFDQSPYYYYL